MPSLPSVPKELTQIGFKNGSLLYLVFQAFSYQDDDLNYTKGKQAFQKLRDSLTKDIGVLPIPKVINRQKLRMETYRWEDGDYILVLGFTTQPVDEQKSWTSARFNLFSSK